jgi:hypothetical protein
MQTFAGKIPETIIISSRSISGFAIRPRIFHQSSVIETTIAQGRIFCRRN